MARRCDPIFAEDTVRTLTMGFTFRVDEDVSKDTMVQMCKRISDMFGDGHEFRPLGNKGILNWARWPGRLLGVGASLKEMRLAIHPKRPVEAIAWPGGDVGEDVLTRWEGDESVCLRRGMYKTILVAIGDAKRWDLEELDVIRGVFRLAGWRVNGLNDIRGLCVEKRKAQPRKRLHDARYAPTEIRTDVVYRDDVRCRLKGEETLGRRKRKHGPDGDIKAGA